MTSFTYISGDAADAQVLAREIPWDTYCSARLISDADLQLLRRYTERSADLRTSMLDESGPAYVEAFLSVLRNVAKDETTQYVLALLTQVLQENPARAKLFHVQSDQHLSTTPEPYAPLLRLLQRSDWYTQEKACKLLTAVIESRPRKSSPDPAEQHINSFVEWLVGQLKRPSDATRAVPTAASCLAALLRERSTRTLFLRAGGVLALPAALKAAFTPTTSQLLYELCLCAWQMTYLKPAAEQMKGSLVKMLVEICRGMKKEKVLRVSLAALKNLLQYETLDLAADMVEAGLQKVVINQSSSSWDDADITDMLTTLDEQLKTGIQNLSTFDKYKKEVLSGSLDWSPMHTSEMFWRDNLDKFEEKEFAVLRLLVKLVENSRDDKTLAVVCHDLGQFITYHPQGRYIVNQLRGKELVMRLLSHPTPEVQKQALLCVQKMMLTKDKLEFLSG